MSAVESYTCYSCGGTFKKQNDEEWSDDKALTEAKETFGDGEWLQEELAVVCDDCYTKLMRSLNN